jgi:integrase
MQIERALPSDLYEKTVSLLGAQCQAPEATQARIAQATLLLLGDCGLRISEAAGATVGKLVGSSFTPGRYQLKITGKRNKVRLVPITPRTHEAIVAHQADVIKRYPDTPLHMDHALIRPISLVRSKRLHDLHEGSGKGYAANALALVVSKTLKAIGGIDGVNVDEMIKLKTTSAHGLRHTFGTMATERDMPIDVVQSILGHASVGTTSIYIRAQERRVAAEAEKLIQKQTQ